MMIFLEFLLLLMLSVDNLLIFQQFQWLSSYFYPFFGLLGLQINVEALFIFCRLEVLTLLQLDTKLFRHLNSIMCRILRRIENVEVLLNYLHIL